MELDFITTLCDEDEVWKEIPVTYRVSTGKEKTVHVPFILTCMNGIYVICREKQDIPEIYRVLRQKFGIREGLYIFVNEEDETGGFLYAPERYNFIEISDFEIGFENFFFNHLIPQSELHLYDFCKLEDYLDDQLLDDEELEIEREDDADKYIRPVVSETNMEHIIDALSKMEDAGYMDGDYLISRDGSMQVKKTITTGSALGFGVAFGNTSEHLFPCEDEDGDKSYLTALFGGWFGLHKFKRGKWGQGILYALTCGVGGVFYVYDLLMMLTGNYHDNKVEYSQVAGRITRKKQRIYARPVTNRKKYAITLLIAFLLSFTLTKFVYIPAVGLFSETITNIGRSYVEKNASDFMDTENSDWESELEEAINNRKGGNIS